MGLRPPLGISRPSVCRRPELEDAAQGQMDNFGATAASLKLGFLIPTHSPRASSLGQGSAKDQGSYCWRRSDPVPQADGWPSALSLGRPSSQFTRGLCQRASACPVLSSQGPPRSLCACPGGERRPLHGPPAGASQGPAVLTSGLGCSSLLT